MIITKMHGLGNDFVIIDGREGTPDPSALAEKICRRRLNVGADGLIILEDAENMVRMRIINADGSEAEMCGNGIRCFARYVWDKGIVKEDEFDVETLAGIMRPRIIKDAEGNCTGVEVDMGEPNFDRAAIPMTGEGEPLDVEAVAAGQHVILNSVLMGVPHTIVFSDDPERDVYALGEAIEKHELYPRKTNVNFLKLIGENKAMMRTWERGAAATMACGTGSCAAAATLMRKGLAEGKVEICLEAGSLYIEKRGGRMFMTGPAEYVFTGEWSDAL